MDADYRVHRANPAAIEQYRGLKYTHDHSEARWLAHRLRLGVLPEGHMYPKAERAVRDVWRKRAHLVRQHTSHVLRVQNILVRNTGVRFGVKQMHQLSKKDLASLLPEAEQVLAVTSALAMLECLSQQMQTLEQAVTKRLKHTPADEQLLSVNGIGPILAQTIALETGHIGRFPTVGNSAAYCRCVRSTTMSNGKRQGQGNAKNGNPSLEWAYREAAPFAIRCRPQVQRFDQQKASKSHLMIARKSVAHKRARACFDSMRDLVPLDGNKAFG
jgi:transposase